MKVFITKEEKDYSIYKVSDHLIGEFREVKKDKIVIEAASIQEAIIQFGKLEQEVGMGFNSELRKFKEGVRQAERSKNMDDTNCRRIKIT